MGDGKSEVMKASAIHCRQEGSERRVNLKTWILKPHIITIATLSRHGEISTAILPIRLVLLPGHLITMLLWRNVLPDEHLGVSHIETTLSSQNTVKSHNM
jgi:hypothetical protein